MSKKLKSNTSRKSLYELSARQRSRVMYEVRQNLRLQYRLKRKNAESNNNNNCYIQDVPNLTECNSSSSNIITRNYDTCNDTRDINLEDNEISSVVSDVSDIVSSSFKITSVLSESSFRERLASCFINNNLTHAQGNSILSLLRTHSCFNNLPQDVRTLLDTPRTRAILYNVQPGEYIHFDVETKIIKNLSHISKSFASTINQLEIDFNTDGCSLDKSGSIQIWPIQCRIANIKHAKPMVVGVYRGPHKPCDPNIFWKNSL